MTTRTKGRFCRVCGAEMVIRKNGKTGEEFWGCTGYPDCQHTEKISTEQRLRMAGHPTFKGM